MRKFTSNVIHSKVEARATTKYICSSSYYKMFQIKNVPETFNSTRSLLKINGKERDDLNPDN